MDFMATFPRFKGFHATLVVMDRLRGCNHTHDDRFIHIKIHIQQDFLSKKYPVFLVSLLETNIIMIKGKQNCVICIRKETTKRGA